MKLQCKYRICLDAKYDYQDYVLFHQANVRDELFDTAQEAEAFIDALELEDNIRWPIYMSISKVWTNRGVVANL
jgi:hypothetical protein